MTVKPIAAGTPQRIISKINEIINAVNTGGGSGGSGTADAILDAATIADAGKALGIDAEGEPALITVSGGGATVHLVQLAMDEENPETPVIVDDAPLNAALAEFQNGGMPLIAYQYPNPEGEPLIRGLSNTEIMHSNDGSYEISIISVNVLPDEPPAIQQTTILFGKSDGPWNVTYTHNYVEIPSNQ